MTKKAVNTERMTVRFPKAEKARFLRLMRAMGYDVEKKNELDLAMDDIMAGRVYTMDSVDDFINSL